ncbi:MAG: thioesterase family protein [Austwickia sp.]|nr:thioesterase family protein [Austwickia sp.]MBK8437445.1 thioesterase family protein [Austwickia sp.]MBK9102712.1 thioesterase family protein [Austwickia sp.]
MLETLTPGLTHTASLTVDDSVTVPSLPAALGDFNDMPVVFATAYLVAFTEATCIQLLEEHLGDGERSVGTHADLSHLAATPVGMTVTAEVELTEVDGKALTFQVRLRDDAGPIGAGTHQRAIIRTEPFNRRLAQKTAEYTSG